MSDRLITPAYEKGQEDAAAGWERCEPRYPVGTPEHRDWLIGWDAQTDFMRAPE